MTANSEEKWLFLDDIRNADRNRWDIVRSYDSFVEYMRTHSVPPVISFDHDLGIEHYPRGEQDPHAVIPYSEFKEKTGYDAAKWLVENNKLPKIALVHSFNTVGAKNIALLMDRARVETIVAPYRPQAYGATKEIG